MTRAEKSLTASALLLLVLSGSAQTRPDFSGHWIAVPDAAPGATNAAPAPPTFGSGLGTDITITQNESTLTVERAQFSQYDIQPAMKFVYALDGSDSRNAINMGRGPQETTSKVAWQDGGLQLTTTYRSEDRDGKPTTSEVRQLFTLESGDTLVISATRGGPPGGLPATSRQVYKKK